MKKANNLLCAALLVAAVSQVSWAQDYPPNAEPGKCYAKCMIPDQYENLTEEVLTKQATQRIEIVPAQFQEAEEQVEVKGATSRLEVVPAVYETVEERIEVKPASYRLEPVAPEYEQIERRTGP